MNIINFPVLVFAQFELVRNHAFFAGVFESNLNYRLIVWAKLAIAAPASFHNVEVRNLRILRAVQGVETNRPNFALRINGVFPNQVRQIPGEGFVQEDAAFRLEEWTSTSFMRCI